MINLFKLLKQLLTFLRRTKRKLGNLKRVFYYRKSLLVPEDLNNRDFIILKDRTKKWRVVGFEDVGEDPHIEIERLKDKKIFLLDQPLFYALQIGFTRNTPLELQLVYAVKEGEYKQMRQTLKALDLC